jgi:hypothetical protein
MTIFSTAVYLSLAIMSIINLSKTPFSLKYKHIKDKLFFLNNKFIFFLNYVLNALSYLILTISFISIPRFLLTTSFITFNYIKDKKDENELDIHPKYFS